jgi:ADP-ribose pyrophosphatase
MEWNVRFLEGIERINKRARARARVRGGGGGCTAEQSEITRGIPVAEQWERVSSQVVGDFDVFRVRRTKARSPRTGEVHEFHVLDLPCCVKVIALTNDGTIVLVEQFRHAVERMSLEFPAGVVEPGEEPVQAAQRELEEETGYRARSTELLVEFDPDPAIQANSVQLIVARGCTADGNRHQDDGEDVRVRLVRPEEISELIRAGVIRHSVAISAWYLYEMLTAPLEGR